MMPGPRASEATTTSDPYSTARIARGVAYLLGGKVVTSIAGFGILLLLVRTLPIEQFAAYSILFALVDLADALTGFGLSHVLSRYVPELFAEHRQAALRRLAAWTLALRFAVLGVLLGVVYLLAPRVAPLIGLDDWEWAFRLYLVVAFARIVSGTLFRVLESTLHQRIAQVGFSLVTVTRFALLALAASQGSLDLATVIAIELATDVLGCLISFVGVLRTVLRDGPGGPREGAEWMRSNFRRMFDFGIKGYLQHMLIMPYGSSVNRLLVGSTLPTADVALFGFAQSVAHLLERYLPLNLLVGVVRPVLTARYVRDRRFADLNFAANLMFKINAIVVLLAAVAIFAGGERMLALVTAGKYSQHAVGLLLMMCALVLMYSLRYMLEHVSHAVERNGPLIWSNAVITCSVLPGIALLPILGVYALPVANLGGLVIGSLVLVWRLRIGGFDYRLDLPGLVRMLAATGVGLAAGRIGHWFDAPWPLTLTAGIAAFSVVLVALKPATQAERSLLMSLLRRR